MDIIITKSAAIEAYDGNASALARALKIEPQAVYQWADDAIPKMQALKLAFILKPDVFGQQAASAKRKRAA